MATKKHAAKKVNPHNIEQKANPNKDFMFGLQLDKLDVGNCNLAGMALNPDYDPTVHPLYYNALPNGIECWDVTEHFTANVAMAMKHLGRAGLKPGQDTVQDYKKAIQYIERQIQKVSGKTRSMKD